MYFENVLYRQIFNNKNILGNDLNWLLDSLSECNTLINNCHYVGNVDCHGVRKMAMGPMWCRGVVCHVTCHKRNTMITSFPIFVHL